ncbi:MULTISPECIES: VOC family protein [unclassified Paenibacillus]|uniref:VOC family protein n=1 Tax=unclassified Paenibacillus TaxID=185978 RepID=UPI00070F3F9C|nr:MULTISPECIES: VOC family protein [unclassified Paenibacillus]KQX57277.1 glyoxalase [Paenibacillus sp. Root444D2]KRE51339.1 glyoxalase [Paenibacillus sp. Soil724D2]
MSEVRMSSPIKNRISNVFIPVRNIEHARDWYCRLLGIAPDGDILFGHLYALPMDGTSLVLDQMPMWGGNEPGGPPTYQTPAFMFQTENIQASYEFMKNNEVELVTEIQNEQWFAFRDPDGNLLMVCK